ncbi:Dam family site-specific DNA-(adenine-N6)-methyltransferase [Rhodoferax sp. 4810]|uniref:site-specific DNA-methyltransferase (adenine-specific) n=1 Tax=Thiospirillum jenense TaxID=1653858 RepID=A0A839H9R9_9GAMM|nr:Dam family site-specific DNA-(adenine-N6)-methyltransferase [Thiospirillum jenense]MBB1073359.1 Dam family site-specific DNA-(adenine-N6)-methyltransferase [Rhodoferax jenense]MBB1125711.1 Dam family site-specific DNA-(adenine-N6)-methyltransferase [Thiospirillum jenense]
MKPLIKYRGGKSKDIQHLKAYIPPFTGRYIEPFVGGGALFFYLEPKQAIINDINAKLMAFYAGVKYDFHTLQQELAKIEKLYTVNRNRFDELKSNNPDVRVPDDNETLYYQFRDMFNGLIERQYSEALLYFFINKTAYSGMIRYNAKGEFNVPYGRYAHFNTSLVTTAHQRLLANTALYNLDYKNIFDLATVDDFMFLDPPYDCVFSDYGNAEYKYGFGEQDHFELATRYKKLNCKALLVIGKTPLTEHLYGDMIIGVYHKSYAVNIKNRFHAFATHLIIANYDPAAGNTFGLVS